MTQETRTFTVRHLLTNEELGVFDSTEEAVNYCQGNNLTPVTIPHNFQFESPLPLPDSPTNFVMYVYNKGD